MYGGDSKKADHVCSELAKGGGEMRDKFFPKDLDEAYYLIDVEQSFTKQTTCSEEVTGKIEGTLNKEEASELFKTGGVLGPDLAPRIGGLSEEANVKFLAAVEAKSTGLTVTKNQAMIDRRKAELDAKKKEEEEAKKKEAEEKAKLEAADPKLQAEKRRNAGHRKLTQQRLGKLQHTKRPHHADRM